MRAKAHAPVRRRRAMAADASGMRLGGGCADGGAAVGARVSAATPSKMAPFACGAGAGSLGSAGSTGTPTHAFAARRSCVSTVPRACRVSSPRPFVAGVASAVARRCARPLGRRRPRRGVEQVDDGRRRVSRRPCLDHAHALPAHAKHARELEPQRLLHARAAQQLRAECQCDAYGVWRQRRHLRRAHALALVGPSLPALRQEEHLEGAAKRALLVEQRRRLARLVEQHLPRRGTLAPRQPPHAAVGVALSGRARPRDGDARGARRLRLGRAEAIATHAREHRSHLDRRLRHTRHVRRHRAQ
eukprot:6152259-Pleurochrysis_carterae.AAC.2